MTEKEFLTAFPDKEMGQFNGATDWSKSTDSLGLAVVPRRIKDAEAYSAKMGVPTDFKTLRGRPIIKSKAQRKALLKAFKMHDQNSFYGD